MRTFHPRELSNLKKRVETPENGQVTIIGGSDLFHGAPILALRAASRIVDMVYFASPEPSIGKVAELLKSQLGSFIWVPWQEVGSYIEKSDAILIGPGMKRWREESVKRKAKSAKIWDDVGRETQGITEDLLKKFPNKQWVIDGGALQTMDAKTIPPSAIVTPNEKEYELLFDDQEVSQVAKEYNCIVVHKGPVTHVCSPEDCVEVTGGNNGLTKGGTGDVLAGLTVVLAAQNDPFLAAAAASWVVKRAADDLLERVGAVYNADDLAEEVPKVLGNYLR
ncbi:MAG: ADP/ATP-dependent (S)-NAD(P)H-hydrate dehydratase [bacterium]|nr:ADP/ATP-dependent (S)-NAD(P)H-hydrate dehydratase [bacterium]